MERVYTCVTNLCFVMFFLLSFTLSIVTFTEINKTSGLFGKKEYLPHLQLFIVLHVAQIRFVFVII